MEKSLVFDCGIKAERTTRRSLVMGPSDGTTHLGRKGCRGYSRRQLGAMKFAIDIRSCLGLGRQTYDLESRPSIWRSITITFCKMCKYIFMCVDFIVNCPSANRARKEVPRRPDISPPSNRAKRPQTNTKG
jgi:hypothetical protein